MCQDERFFTILKFFLARTRYNRKRVQQGGIHIADGFRLGMKYLTDKQYEILYQISERLDGEEKTVVLGILKTFAYPKKGVDGKKSST